MPRRMHYAKHYDGALMDFVKQDMAGLRHAFLTCAHDAPRSASVMAREAVGRIFYAVYEEQANARIDFFEVGQYAVNISAGGAGPDQLSHGLAASALLSLARAAAMTSSCEYNIAVPAAIWRRCSSMEMRNSSSLIVSGGKSPAATHSATSSAAYCSGEIPSSHARAVSCAAILGSSLMVRVSAMRLHTMQRADMHAPLPGRDMAGSSGPIPGAPRSGEPGIHKRKRSSL